MKNIKNYIIESDNKELIDNAKAIACAIIVLNNENANYSLELKTKKIKPTLSEKDIFTMAEEIKKMIDY